MLRNGISYARLMQTSTDCIALAQYGADPQECLIATRLLSDPATWQRWECEHSGLMRGIAEYSRLPKQLDALKRTALRLIHRKALFEYLRDRQVRGVTRMRILTHFHPARSYTHATVAEHGVYVRSAGSYYCSSYIGCDAVQGPEFVDPLECYEQLYAEYFNAYCSAYFPADGIESASTAALLPLLKHQLEECRRAIFDPRFALPRFAYEHHLRRRTGDTQRLGVSELRAKLARS